VACKLPWRNNRCSPFKGSLHHKNIIAGFEIPEIWLFSKTAFVNYYLKKFSLTERSLNNVEGQSLHNTSEMPLEDYLPQIFLTSKTYRVYQKIRWDFRHL
jgi:hypothetical protein